MRPATHDSLFNVSLMPPGGCAWTRIQAGAPPPLNHIRDALAKVSGPPPPFIDDMAGKDGAGILLVLAIPASARWVTVR